MLQACYNVRKHAQCYKHAAMLGNTLKCYKNAKCYKHATMLGNTLKCYKHATMLNMLNATNMLQC